MVNPIIRYIPNVLVGARYNIQALEYWSENALANYKEYINYGGTKSKYYSSGNITVERSVPVNVMISMMAQDNTLKGIIEILRNYVMPNVITRDEDNLINEKGLKASMPKGNDSIFARYDVAGKGKINMLKFVTNN